MDKVNTFTSTGQKLLKHPDLLKSWMENRPIPHSLQVALTERCNLSCSFCSVANRSRKFEFEYDELISATEKFLGLGVKTVEITGGGEPLCYPELNAYLENLERVGIEVGLITNGININQKIDKAVLEKISWIRISANAYDEMGYIDIPEFSGTLGLSYVWDDRVSSVKTLMRLKELPTQYIRLIPNCIGTKEEQSEKNEYLSRLAKWIGPPVFFQWKEFNAPSSCYWGYLKPFLYPDGNVYPCSSIVLNPDANREFHESYRVCHWSEIKSIWKGPIQSLADTSRCSHCVFTKQNEILEYCLYSQRHENFL